MTIDEIIQVLNSFEPFSDDDTVNDNETFLSDLMEKWESNQDYKKAIPAMFHLIEKFPNADFGSPGPLVHSLEAKGVKQYEAELQISLLRKPTALTIWMYNRIINAERDKQIISGHIERLKLFSKHPFVNAEAKQTAEGFIEHQLKRL
jgi:hypothetical protein